MSKKVSSQADVYELIRVQERRFRQHIRSRIPRSFVSAISPEDVLQDVRLVVRAQLDVFRGATEDAPNTWLKRLATGCTVDAIKTEKRIKRSGGAHAINQSVLERSSLLDLYSLGIVFFQVLSDGQVRTCALEHSR